MTEVKQRILQIKRNVLQLILNGLGCGRQLVRQLTDRVEPTKYYVQYRSIKHIENRKCSCSDVKQLLGMTTGEPRFMTTAVGTPVSAMP